MLRQARSCWRRPSMFLWMFLVVAVLMVSCSRGASQQPAPSAPAAATKAPAAVTAPVASPAVPAPKAPAAATTPVPAPKAAAVPAPTGKRGGILRIATGDTPLRWEAQASVGNSTWQINAPVYNTLIAHDPADQLATTFVPELAESWAFSDGGRTLTFKLRRDVKWHDGTPFTAGDVVSTFVRIIAPPKDVLSARQGLFASVLRLRSEDDYTVAFELAFPDPTILEAIASGWHMMTPKHQIEQLGGVVEAQKTLDRPGVEVRLGTGPFRMVRWALNSYMDYDRYPDYWKKGLPYLDGIKRITLATDATVPALLGGQVDSLWPSLAALSDPENLETVETQGRGRIELVKGVFLTPPQLFLNQERPGLKDIRVRQAIAEAMDRNRLRDADRNAVPGSDPQFAAPGAWWALPKEELQKLPGFGADMAKRLEHARGLLKDAGYTKEKPLVLSLLFSPPGRYEPVIQPMIQAIGPEIRVNLTPAPGGRNLELRVTGEFDMAGSQAGLAGIDPNHIFGTFLLRASASNQSRTYVPEAEALYLKQRGTLDLKERKALVDQMHKLYLENAAYFLYYWRNGGHARWNYVKGFQLWAVQYSSSGRLDTVWLDK